MRELDDARYKAIGARIRDVRLQRNMSQAELAEKAFISVPHMSEVENGKTKLRLSTFVYITEALQVSADVLLRTNTPEVNGIYQGEFNNLLADCSPAEIDSIQWLMFCQQTHSLSAPTVNSDKLLHGAAAPV